MTWTRDPGAAAGAADVVLAALHRGPLLDLPTSISRFGPVSADVEVLEHAGLEAEAWIDGFRRGALRTIAGRDLGDLGGLQGAWSIARWCCARGADVVVFEETPSPGLGGHVLHTRGMRKLGRPELVTGIDAADRASGVEALWQIARRLVGVPVSDAPEDIPLFLTPAPPGSFVGALHLDNDAVLVVGADGGAPVWPRGEPRRG